MFFFKVNFPSLLLWGVPFQCFLHIRKGLSMSTSVFLGLEHVWWFARLLSLGPFFNKCSPAVGWPAWEWWMRRHVDLLIFWDTWTVVDCWVEPYLSFLYPIPSFSESYSIHVFSWYRCVFLPMVHVWFILIHTDSYLYHLKLPTAMFTPAADPSGLRRAITLPYSFRQGMGQNLTPRGPQILVYF